MGNEVDDFRAPKKEKLSFDKSNGYIKIGACEMQGWRRTMEDAAIVLMDYQKDSSLFGILDGHGGSVVSKFVANNLKAILIRTEAYKNGEYERALIESYILMDEILKDPEVIQFLYQIDVEKKQLNIKSSEVEKIKQKKNEVIFKLRYEKNSIEYVLKKIDNSIINKKNNSKIFVSLFKEKGFPNKSSGSPNENGANISTSESDKKEEEELNEHFDQSNYEILFEDNKECKDINAQNLKALQEMPREKAKLVNEMGTTANVLLIKDRSLYLANIGDSQSVMFKNGKAITLNREHKTYLRSEHQRIIKSGSKIFKDRIDGILNLTRALGDFCFKSKNNLSNIEQSVIAYPEITQLKGDDGIEFIVMGCDGVWDCVDNKQETLQKIHDKIKKNPEGNLSEIIAQLFDQNLAKDNATPKGTDNMSCIIIQFLKNSTVPSTENQIIKENK